MTALMDVLQGAIDIDTNIFLFINGMHNTFFDYFMSAYRVSGSGCRCMLPFGM